MEQTGTAQEVSNGVPYYYAWWEMWSSINHQPEQTITTMRVSPGDSITASVTYQTSGTYAGDYLLSINDTSHSNDSFSTYANPPQYQDPLPDRSTAEWIMETPGVNGGLATLPNFGSITFTNCNAAISGTAVQVQAVNLNRNGVTLDTTSALTSGTSFSVLYDSSGTAGQSATLQSGKKTGGLVIGRPAGTGAAGQSGSNANGMTQIGPTVGATRQSGKKTGRPVIGRPAGTGARGPTAIPQANRSARAICPRVLDRPNGPRRHLRGVRLVGSLIAMGAGPQRSRLHQAAPQRQRLERLTLRLRTGPEKGDWLTAPDGPGDLGRYASGPGA